MNKHVDKAVEMIIKHLEKFGFTVESCDYKKYRGDYGSVLYDAAMIVIAPDEVAHEIVTTFFDHAEPCDMSVDGVRYPMPEMSRHGASSSGYRIARSLAVHALQGSQTCLLSREGGEWVATLDDGRGFRKPLSGTLFDFIKWLDNRGVEVYCTVPLRVDGRAATVTLGVWRESAGSEWVREKEKQV